MNPTDYGFILTRHVNSEKTNHYWNNNVKLLRTLYPYRKIVIIDDNSNPAFLKPEFTYKNVEVVQSEYPGRGELLPYVYLLRHKWFQNAVILHDSVFFHKRVPFEKVRAQVMPFWHFTADRENIGNTLRIAGHLKHNAVIKRTLSGDQSHATSIAGAYGNNRDFVGCFGVQSYINLEFLQKVDKKYGLEAMLDAVTCRADRCCLERVMGAIFCVEYPPALIAKSLFGNIQKKPRAFGYTYDDYLADRKARRLETGVIKVWSGR